MQCEFDVLVVDVRKLSSFSILNAFMDATSRKLGLTQKWSHVWAFSNGSDFGIGLTGFSLLEESNITIHTRPEKQLLNIDIWSCREYNRAEAFGLVEQYFGPFIKVLRDEATDRNYEKEVEDVLRKWNEQSKQVAG